MIGTLSESHMLLSDTVLLVYFIIDSLLANFNLQTFS